jgi:hypothetical protein
MRSIVTVRLSGNLAARCAEQADKFAAATPIADMTNPARIDPHDILHAP